MNTKHPKLPMKVAGEIWISIACLGATGAIIANYAASKVYRLFDYCLPSFRGILCSNTPFFTSVQWALGILFLTVVFSWPVLFLIKASLKKAAVKIRQQPGWNKLDIATELEKRGLIIAGPIVVLVAALFSFANWWMFIGHFAVAPFVWKRYVASVEQWAREDADARII